VSNSLTPLVSTQFQYADVGVNVDLIPHVHGKDEVTLHVDIDVSSVADHVDIGGVSQPIIGQRKIGHEVRLKEGQATVLAGLAQLQDSKSITGLPGFINVPVLRGLFGGDKVDRGQSDLLIVLIPHIVRTPQPHTPESRSEGHWHGGGNQSAIEVKSRAAPNLPGTSRV